MHFASPAVSLRSAGSCARCARSRYRAGLPRHRPTGRDAGERGGPDLGLAQCVKSEQAVRERLVKEWSTFASADKANCVGEEKSGPLPSYTDLVTCLEMARDARKMTNK